MAEIYVVVRNEEGVAMSSVDGTAVLVSLVRHQWLVYQKNAVLRAAVAQFSQVPGGHYSILVRYPDPTPTEVRYDHVLTDKMALGVRFVYNEPQRLSWSILTDSSKNGMFQAEPPKIMCNLSTP